MLCPSFRLCLSFPMLIGNRKCLHLLCVAETKCMCLINCCLLAFFFLQLDFRASLRVPRPTFGLWRWRLGIIPSGQPVEFAGRKIKPETFSESKPLSPILRLLWQGFCLLAFDWYTTSTICLPDLNPLKHIGVARYISFPFGMFSLVRNLGLVGQFHLSGGQDDSYSRCMFSLLCLCGFRFFFWSLSCFGNCLGVGSILFSSSYLFAGSHSLKAMQILYSLFLRVFWVIGWIHLLEFFWVFWVLLIMVYQTGLGGG